jgi:WXG100 family type VII secretion target
MSRYQVDSDALLSATAAVRGSMGTIEAEIARLSAQLTGLQGSWSGQAAIAFQSVATDWTATQRRVSESLAAINQALTLAGQQYQDIEAQNARLFLG